MQVLTNEIKNIEGKNKCLITDQIQDFEYLKNNGFKAVFLIDSNFFEFIGDNIESFEPIDTIYLASKQLKYENEVTRRLGVEKCLKIDLCDFVTFENYVKSGVSILEILGKAKEFKIEGVFTADDCADEMLHTFINGKKRGTTTYIPSLDLAWTWRGGEVNVWTGYQNEGKSLFLNQLCLLRSYWEDCKVAVFSPESMPMSDYFDELIETFIGKSSDNHFINNKMSLEEYTLGMRFVNNNFFLIYPKIDFTLDTIIERIVYLVKRRGVRTVIIDPYNTIEHKMANGQREDLYISQFMAKLKHLAVKYDLSINLVAHQLTARRNAKDKDRYFKPDLNNIKGGGTFADKADNVLFVWRHNRANDFSCPEVVIGSQKIKKQKLVGRPQDLLNVTFDIKKQRYNYDGFCPFNEIDIDFRGKNSKELKLELTTSFDENGETFPSYISNFDPSI